MRRANGRVSCVSAVVACLMILPCRSAPAAPVFGDKFELRQPDGDMVEVRIWGDEFYRVVESLDGYTLIRDADTGVICYARLSPGDAKLVSSGVRVGDSRRAALGIEPHLRIAPAAARAQARSARASLAELQKDDPSESALTSAVHETAWGPSLQGICLIVDFPDEPWTIPPAEIDNLCNQPGYTGYGNNGSVRDYFYDVSDGQLTYTNYVPTAYYTALHEKSYYDACDGGTGGSAYGLVEEALQALDDSGFDFSQYDSDGDGYVDAVNCWYEGTTHCGWSEGLWPHAGWVHFEADGVRTRRYRMKPPTMAVR